MSFSFWLLPLFYPHILAVSQLLCVCERRYVRNHLTFKCTRNCSHFHKYVNFHSPTHSHSNHRRVNKSCVMDSSQNVLSLFISFYIFFLSRVGKKTPLFFSYNFVKPEYRLFTLLSCGVEKSKREHIRNSLEKIRDRFYSVAKRNNERHRRTHTWQWN